MTVRELMERLRFENADADVVFSYPSHDFWGTVRLASIEEIGVFPVDVSSNPLTLDVDADGNLEDAGPDTEIEYVVVLR